MLLSAAGFVLPGEYAWLFMLLLVPALMVSGSILLLRFSEEYQEHVQDRILKVHDWKHILLGSEA